MSIRRLIDDQISKADGDLVGRIASPWYEIQDIAGNWQWACDVDIGSDDDSVLQNVPLALNNREILYTEPGKPVALKKVGNARYEIVGLSKHVLSDRVINYVNFTDSMGQVVGRTVKKNTVRKLLYEELETYGGYGVVPYGTYGRFDYDGNLLKLLY